MIIQRFSLLYFSFVILFYLAGCGSDTDVHEIGKSGQQESTAEYDMATLKKSGSPERDAWKAILPDNEPPERAVIDRYKSFITKYKEKLVASSYAEIGQDDELLSPDDLLQAVIIQDISVRGSYTQHSTDAHYDTYHYEDGSRSTTKYKPSETSSTLDGNYVKLKIKNTLEETKLCLGFELIGRTIEWSVGAMRYKSESVRESFDDITLNPGEVKTVERYINPRVKGEVQADGVRFGNMLESFAEVLESSRERRAASTG